MTNNLMDQLTRYGNDFVEATEPLTFEEVAPRRVGTGPVRPLAPRRVERHAASRRTALVAAILVLIAGFVTLLAVRSAFVEPAAPTPTTTAPPTTTTLPVTTTAPQRDASGVTGTQIEWRSVMGNPSTIPAGFHMSPSGDGQFVAFDPPNRFVSTDGVTWSVTDLGTPEGAGVTYPVETSNGLWLVEVPEPGSGGRSALYRLDGQKWVPVDLETAQPAIDGLEWSVPQYGAIAGVGSLVIIESAASANVPWGDLYGTFTDPDPSAPQIVREPSVWWEADQERFVVSNPFSGDEIAVVNVDIRSTSPVDIVFADAATGEVVHRVLGDIPGATESSLIESFGNVFGTTLARSTTWWVSLDGGATFVESAVPWEGTTADTVVGTLDGSVYIMTRHGDLPTDFEIWRTSDGVTWLPVQAPAIGQFAPGSAGVRIRVEGDALLATVEDQGGVDVWRSTDGESWEHLGTAPGSTDGPTDVGLTSAGWIAVGMDGIWMSQDFDAWDRIGDAPMSNEEVDSFMLGNGSMAAFVVGDSIAYSTTSFETGERVLWIGTVVR